MSGTSFEKCQKLFRQVTPPFLLTLIKFLLSKVSKMPNAFSLNPSSRIDFNTFDEALRYCSKGGYENSDLVKVVVEKTSTFKERIEHDSMLDLNALRVITAVGLSSTKKRLNVIDFGGASGYHYFIAAKILGRRFPIKWNVVETSEMVNQATSMSTENLGFFEKIDQAKRSLGIVDLVFSSGTLHCCPDPFSALQDILNVDAEFVFITRTALLDREQTIIHIQKSNLSENGPGALDAGIKDSSILYPNVFVPRKIFEKKLSENYEIQFSILEGVGYRLQHDTVNLYGYFCTRKADSLDS